MGPDGAVATTPSGRRPTWFDLAAGVGLVAAILLTFGHNVDDTFITLRYARNVLEGHGPVFNAGERVEGFSSPLHLVVLIAIQMLPGGYLLLKVKLFSVVCIVANLLVARRLLSHVPAPASVRGMALVGVGGSYVLAMAGGNGLSTALSAVLTLWLALLLVDGTAVRAPWRAGVVGALVVFVRPEGAWMVAMMVGAFVLARDQSGSGLDSGVRVGTASLRSKLRWVVWPAVFLVVMLVARLAYYGSLLPNPYFAKHAPVGTAFRTGVAYAARGVFPSARWVVDSPQVLIADAMLLVVLVTFAVGIGWCLRSRSIWLVPAAIPLAQIVFVCATGADWMKGSRFMTVAVVPGLITVILGLGATGRWWSGRFGHGQRVVTSASIAVLALVGIVAWLGAGRFDIGRSHGRFDDHSLLATGGYDGWTEPLRLLGCANPGDVVAMTEIGYTPWVRDDLRFMDLSGLNDRVLARRAENRFVGVGLMEPVWGDSSNVTVQEVLRRRPEMVIVSNSPDPGSAFADQYRRVDSARFPTGVFEAWLRRDLPCDR